MGRSAQLGFLQPEVPGNLPILEVTEPRNNMSYLCRSVFQYGFCGVFTGLTSSVIHMHYTPPSFEELGCHSESWIPCCLWSHGIKSWKDAVTYLQEYGLFSRHRGQPSPRIEL